MPNRIEWHEARVEVHAVDERIGRDDVERAPGRRDDRGVVAGPSYDPGRGRHMCLDPGDERALSDVRYRERLQSGPARREEAAG